MVSTSHRPAPAVSGAATVRLIPQDPQWLHDFYLTHDLLLAPYHAAWSARQRGTDEDSAPAFPAGLENLPGLDAPASLAAWNSVHRGLPPVLRDRRIVHGTHDPVRRSVLRAPDGSRLIPLHPVMVDEADLRALEGVRRAVRAGAKTRPSIRVTRRGDGSAAVDPVAGPGDCRGTIERTVAVLALPVDDDVELLAAILAPERVGTGVRRVDLSGGEYRAYGRFADRLAAAAMTGQFPGDRAVFRSRY
ncbi:hypothetical protein ACFV0T_41180 [Streptomyces sp. NPDC059582]|uniref:hypothetical protein n=1 Tax=Streptomyces sp. NPDC059582 TaxID=3346875 RepID=UPI0036869816